MNIPLQARSKGTSIQIVVDGELKEVRPPILPYILATADATLDETYKKERYKLFSGKEVELQKFEYLDLHTFEEKRNQLRDRRTFSLQHMEEIYVDAPDFFLDYPTTKPPKVLTFDIEVLSDGSGIFPRASSSPIIAIGCKIDNGPVIIFDGLDPKTKDRKILQDFFEFLRTEDPDIIAGYNSWSFDLNYIQERAKIHRIPADAFGRWPDETDIFFGRINWDVYINDVAKDQNPDLLNLKNRKLETIYHFFTGKTAVSIDASNTKSFLVKDTEGLMRLNPVIRSYLECDVESTKAIFDIYYVANLSLAEFLKVPLGSVIRVSNSFIPKIYYTRGLKSLGYMALDSNNDRYPDIRGKYEAAIVSINGRCSECGEVLFRDHCLKCDKDLPEERQLKAGFFPQIHKVDFAAYYASTLITFNLSPETTRYIKSYDYNESIYPLKIEQLAGRIRLHVPDKNYNRTMVLEIDQNKEGFLKQELLKLREARAVVKAEMKKYLKGGGTEKDPIYRTLYSQQDVYKLLGNKCYGYNGAPHSTFGEMPVALAIVALCRWMTLGIETQLQNKIVEIDTDGFLLHVWEDGLEVTLTNWLNKRIEDTFGITDSYIVLEHDVLKEGFFYKCKSYIVKTPKDVIIKHGAAFKSSRYPKIHDRAVDMLADIILNQKTVDWFDVVAELRDFSGLSVKDFTMRAKMGKEKDDYENKKALALKLAAQAEKATKREAEVGDQMEYVVTKGKQYTLRSLVKSVAEIDRPYYEQVVNNVLEMFDISINPAQQELF